MSFTKRGDTRKCRAASRCPCPSSTKAMTRVRSSIGCDLPSMTPYIWQSQEIIKPLTLGILNRISNDTL